MQKVIQLNFEDIKLPFEAYQLQKRMMKMILEAISKKKNLIIESPTGTGKTLCLLSSTLQAVEKKGIRRVYYLTRTHSQMQGIIKQIKGTCYQPKFSILQSIKPLCVHKPALKMGDKMSIEEFNGLCKMARSTKSTARNVIPECSRKYNFKIPKQQNTHGAQSQLFSDKTQNNQKRKKTYKQKIEQQNQYAVQFPPFNRIQNMQSIKYYAQQNGYCPFAYVKALSKKSQLIIMPYIYLLNPFIFHRKDFNLHDSVIIFDEAHNVIDQAKQQNNVQIRQKNIENTRRQMSILRDLIIQQKTQKQTFQQLNIYNTLNEYFMSISKIFSILKQYYQKQKNNQLVFLEIPQLLKIVNLKLKDFISFKTKNNDKIEQFLFRLSQNKSQQGFKKKKGAINTFINICYSLSLIQSHHVQDNTYFCILSAQQNRLTKNIQFQIKFHCKSSKFIFNKFSECKTMLFASGTVDKEQFYSDAGLNFMNAFQIEYKTQNPYQMNNVERFQITIAKGEDLKIVKDYPNYQQVIYLLTEIIPSIPNGVLVFFKSSSYMKQIQRLFIENNIIIQNKKIYFQQIGGQQFINALNSYKQEAQKKQGAVFFSYMRGKLSEGCNFKDHLARAVFIVGLPLADLGSMPVKIQKKILPNSSQFWRWYIKNAMQAVNQAVGRVLRHSKDYGQVFLFGKDLCAHQKKLPKWLQRSKCYKKAKIPFIKQMIEKFYRNRNVQDIIKFKQQINNEIQDGSEEEDYQSDSLKNQNSQKYQKQSEKSSSNTQNVNKSSSLNNAPYFRITEISSDQQDLQSLLLKLKKQREEDKQRQSEQK